MFTCIRLAFFLCTSTAYSLGSYDYRPEPEPEPSAFCYDTFTALAR